MTTNVLKRAMPFVITLMVGTGLGNIFGFHNPATNTIATSRGRFVVRDDPGVVELNTHTSATRPTILYQPSTRFTPRALENQTSGVVTLLVRFNVDGTTTVVEKLSTLPDGLTEDAERVAIQTRFTPATVDGTPVTVTKEMNYIYSPRDRETRDP